MNNLPDKRIKREPPRMLTLNRATKMTPEQTISEKQLAANRENSKHSTGPKTEEGKKRSQLNSRRHGLTGQFYALTPEDQAAFDRHCDSLLADLKPETWREKQLAISIAEDQWRLNRARALENNMFALGHGTQPGNLDCLNEEVHACLAQARTWMAESNNIQLLSLYETRIRRNIEKNEKRLEALQSARKDARDKAMEEALLLAQLALMKGETWDASQQIHGFVFSGTEINRLIGRNLRIQEARFYQKHAWNRRAPWQKPALRMPQAA